MILIDGLNLFYRSYYALAGFGKVKREVTPGLLIHRVVSEVLVNKANGDVLFVHEYSGKRSFRADIYDQYKANRQHQDISFNDYRDDIVQLLNGFGVSTICHKGVEADDIIASYAIQTKDCIILSSDKDFKQLLRSGVAIFNPQKKTLITKNEFIKEYGFKPRYFVDYLALTGDKVDNIPGVKGIGHVMAVNLLKEYGDLKSIYANIDAIKGATRDKLLSSKDDAFMSYKLAKMKTNIKLNITPQVKNESLVNPICDKYMLVAIRQQFNQPKGLF